MLQYPLQLPPLSLSSSPKSAPKDNDYFRPHEPRFPPNPLTKRLNKDSFVNRSVISPLAISANHAPSPSNTSPSANSIKLPRSPYISSRPLSTSIPISTVKAHNGPTQSRASSASSTIEDVLAPGDIVGEGCSLQGESIRLVSISSQLDVDDDPELREPAQEFEVVRRLGSGSYAVVYLVKEVLSRSPPSEDGHMSTIGSMEFDSNLARRPETLYGREYAVKCLSKANLDEEALDAQLTEVTIHQSLHSHPNIVTLHRTLETSSFLLLLLEYVPGEDLFYFLEQARDHHEPDSLNSADAVSISRTPPTPSLLSNLHPSQLLSRTRLRLIASMFAQMCDAVAACHAQQVFHRDIKPENFIVTDGFVTLSDGRQERKVIVKLTDFGLSTTDIESSDMDCGSAPYMSYECRNNVAPTYRPRAADVWSLGIVLINMLYHFNPWTDTCQGACSSFDLYRRDPVNFFMYRFTGMTRPVAEFLANRVFCILDDPGDDSPRVTASEFGMWVKNLPTLLGGCHGMHRSMSSSSTQGHPIASSTPLSHRPTSRNPSVSAKNSRTPALVTRSLSRAPSLGPAYEREEPSELSTVYDQEYEELQPELEEKESERSLEEVQPQPGEDDPVSIRTTSTKRRKRGLRRKGPSTATPTTTTDETLITLTIASQALAREISKASRASSTKSASTKASATSSTRTRGGSYEPPPIFAMPTHLITGNKGVPPAASPTPPPLPNSSCSSTATAPVKKPSKWKLSFGKQNGAVTITYPEDNAPPSPQDLGSGSHQPMSTTASNVTSLIMSLNAPTSSSAVGATNSVDDRQSTWTRGRRGRGSPTPTKSSNKSPGYTPSTSPNNFNTWAFGEKRSERGVSPNSTRSGRSGRPVASSASSVASGNWRSSMSTTSSAGTSTSAFTRYSNSSNRSISTTATSVSSASWRTGGKGPQSSASSTHSNYPTLPKNIKIMSGVPWELDQLPRGQYPNPVGDIFGSPPQRKPRTRKTKDPKLDTINERPGQSGGIPRAPENLRRDASTSTTDLAGNGREDGSENVKKVQKGQINALAKMLSALRRP